MNAKYHIPTALITGGANGIGAGIASLMAENNYQVIITDVDEANGQALAQNHENITFIKADVQSEDEILKVFSFIKERYLTLDVLINNLGISEFKPLVDLTVNEWDKVLNTNLRSAFICSREFARLHKKDSYGRIINIASTRHLMSEPNSEAYAASKGGLVSLTHALAASLQDSQTTVNCISPGWIHTPAHGELSAQDNEQHFSKRVGTPEDIARFCLHLCQPENNFITGQNFYIDGGMTKKMNYD